jgi:16S rRNA (adenine1518-N6/adenine1519-N6)-dimethyltransferase
MKIMSIKTVKLILREIGIIPNKNLGQNFLIDNNLLKKVILESEIRDNDVILEVGGGLGALTDKLAEQSKKLYVYEIEFKLFQYLEARFAKFNNTIIINEDILKAEIPFHNKVVSNIPYNITGPLLQKLFYKENPPSGIMIIEKSLANRIFFPSTYKNISRLSISFNSFMNPIKKIDISPKCFYPTPNIKLSLVKMKPKENLDPFLLDPKSREFYLRFVAGIMPYKNKNLSNALKLHFKNQKLENLTKVNIIQLLEENNYKNKKVFKYSVEDFVKLSKKFYKFNEIKSLSN